jgi:hypothetical protein
MRIRSSGEGYGGGKNETVEKCSAQSVQFRIHLLNSK